MPNAQPVPKGYHSVTPYLVVDDAKRAIEFYKRAFGAQETARMDGPHGKIAHAEIRIGDSMVMLSDEMPGAGNKSAKTLGGSPVGLMIYVDNVDAVFKQAVAAGAKVVQPLENQFWGDRYGRITDPFGIPWSLATHIEDVSPQEMAKRSKEAMEKMMQRPQPVG